MTYSVLIRKNPKGGYTATAMGWPKLAAHAATRAQALKRIQTTITKLVAQGELIELEISLPPSKIKASYDDVFGMFREDPTFEQFARETQVYHRKRNRA